MKKKLQLTEQAFERFEDYLRHDEREESTIEAYLRSLTRFSEWAAIPIRVGKYTVNLDTASECSAGG